MLTEIGNLLSKYSGYIIPALVFVLFILVGYGVKWIIDSYVVRLAKRTKTKIDDVVISAIRMPIVTVFILAGVGFVLQYIELPPQISIYLQPSLFIAVVFVIGYCIAKIIAGLIGYEAVKRPGIKTAAPIVQRVLQLVIYLICLMIVLDKLGISITPLLTTLGIAGIAVAFALQETLSNFFAGFYIMADRPVRVGDYIKLESGEEGYVADIGWRSTKIRALPNNIIVVPNSKLANSVITNYYLPEQSMACLVQVGVSYDSDLEKVERVTIEVAKEILGKVPGGAKDFQPFIRYNAFSDFSVNFTVTLKVNEFVDKYLVTHEFIKALHKRYKEEGIEIPFPIRTVYMRGEK
ncbi:MAG: mechanosensitive ion channel family protein [Candidatus Thermoplasmatota archaeon]